LEKSLMDEKEFVALVQRLELQSSRNPAGYKLRVALLALLGYLFLFGILGIVLLIVAATIYVGRINYLIIKVLLIPLGIGALILRSLWIEFPEPEGVELTPNDAPRLFDQVHAIAKTTEGPNLHRVLLTGDYNAAILQRPRLGILGWQENYLLIGLPLLQALSSSDLRAVLAHEFGHLSGNHGRFAGWIYRVRQTWLQVLVNAQQHRKYGSGFFEYFFNWYAPYFSAYSFVFARAQEYEADQCAVRVAGQEQAARALINLELKAKALTQDFWPGVYKLADQQETPPKDAFSQMLHMLVHPLPADKMKLWFSEAIGERRDYDNTHPSLSERLAAIGYPEINSDSELLKDAPFGPSSLDYFQLNVPSDFIASKNRLWTEGASDIWSQRHSFVREAEQSLTLLNQKSEKETLTLEEQWDRARYVAGTKGMAEAVPFLREVLQTKPDHAAANYTIGEALLEAGDEQGIQHIEAALEKDVDGIPSGCRLIYSFLMTRQREQEANKYLDCISAYYREVDLAAEERQNISVKDEFSPHGLTAEQLVALREQLASYPHLGIAYFVRKVVKHFPDQPGYVLGVITKTPWHRLQSNKADQSLVNELAELLKCPGYTYIIALEHQYRPLRKVFKRIEGAQVYSA